MNLNPSQTAAVMCDDPRIVVSATAGAGKTRTLVERIRHRAAINPMTRFVCLTYTNAGAKEMSDRLDGLQDRILFVGTLHGYCYRLLNQHGNALGYREGGVTLLREEDAETLLDQCAKALGYKGSWKAITEKRPGTELIWKEYAHRLRRNNVVDFDTILDAGLRILDLANASRLGELNELQQNTELLVDEMQDGAEIDGRIYREFPASSKFFVGDQDQAIFSFRGARPDLFGKMAEESTLLLLESNYRSTASICEAATSLIRHNKDRIDKAVVPTNETRGGICVLPFDTDLDEYRMTAAHVRACLSATGSDIAVLCRTNYLVVQFRDALEAAGVPVQRAKRRDLPPDFGRALDVISLMVDPRSDLIAERVLAAMKAPVADCKKEAIERGTWLSSVGRTRNLLPVLAEHTAESLVTILPRFGIGRETCDMIAQRARLLPGRNPTLVDLLHDLFAHDRWDPEPDIAGVVVTTLHGAKGREFDAVFLPAFEEGICPSLKRDSDPEEERRLAFVGMTRARHKLIVSWSRKRKPQFGPVVETQPSRFLLESGLTNTKETLEAGL